MTGEQAVESKQRESSWFSHGCNYHVDDTGGVISKPLGSVSLDTVLYAIERRKIPICEDYGEIEKVICSNKNGYCYRCDKSNRTGCALCGFGIKFDPFRFVRLQETDSSKVNIAFKPIEQGGLGYLEVCEYLNEYCRTNISIPHL